MSGFNSDGSFGGGSGGGLLTGIEIAPIVKQSDTETVFKGSNNSHFSYVKNEGFHVTTEIPGLGQGIRIAIQDKLYKL